MQVLTLGQRVADMQVAVIGDADDVAGPGFFGQLAVLRQKQHRVVQRDLLVGAHVL